MTKRIAVPALSAAQMSQIGQAHWKREPGRKGTLSAYEFEARNAHRTLCVELWESQTLLGQARASNVDLANTVTRRRRRIGDLESELDSSRRALQEVMLEAAAAQEDNRRLRDKMKSVAVVIDCFASASKAHRIHDVRISASGNLVVNYLFGGTWVQHIFENDREMLYLNRHTPSEVSFCLAEGLTPQVAAMIRAHVAETEKEEATAPTAIIGPGGLVAVQISRALLEVLAVHECYDEDCPFHGEAGLIEWSLTAEVDAATR